MLAERGKRPFGALAAAGARGAEEDHGVLDVLRPEAPERLEVLGQDADRPRVIAREELRHQVGQGLRIHGAQHSISYDAARPPLRRHCPRTGRPGVSPAAVA